MTQRGGFSFPMFVAAAMLLILAIIAGTIWATPSNGSAQGAQTPTPTVVFTPTNISTAVTSLTCPTAADLQSLGYVEQWLYENQMLSGAQISFNSDFSASSVSWGNAIDGIQYQGNNVTSVPAGSQASVWIKPACRPIAMNVSLPTPTAVPSIAATQPAAVNTLVCPKATDLAALGAVLQWLYENNQLAGAQINFLSDFTPQGVTWGKSVDGIQAHGNNVSNVIAGDTASVWIVPACRPLQ